MREKKSGSEKVAAGENSTVIEAGFVLPSQNSETKLGPGLYSMNKRCNVPFVSLVGSAGFRKMFSWGELAEVPVGQIVSIHNASFHGGDIVLNKGGDICNRPSRISVPVEMIMSMTAPGFEGVQPLWTNSYPCDTRGAKRAYLNVDAFVNPISVVSGGGPLTAFIRGRRIAGSMNTESSLRAFGPPWGPGVGFLSAIEVPVNTTLNYIPFGQGASFSGTDTRSHNLLDAGDIFFLFPIGAILADVMTWPADSGVFSFPTGKRPAPGTWFVIEYE